MAIFHNENAMKPAVSAEAAAYSVDYSCRFDGASYLSRANGDSATTWTMAFWLKRSTLTQSGHSYLVSWAGSTEGISFRGTSDTGYDDKISVYTGSQNYTTRVFRDPSAWYHCCLAVTSGTGVLYINGESIKTGITGIAATGTIQVGAWSGGSNFNGYIADFHYISGTAVTPDTNFVEKDANGQLVPIAYTEDHGTNGFHIPFDNTAGSDVFTDSSGSNAATAFTDSSRACHHITNSGATHSATEKKIGRTSMYFDGNDYLSIPDSEAFNMGSGDFTVECWINPDGVSTAQIIFSQHNSDGADASGSIALYLYTDGKIYPTFYDSANATSYHPAYTNIVGVTISADAWTHIAYTRSGTTVTLYKNGVSAGTTTLGSGAVINNSTNTFAIGRAGEHDGAYYSGYLDDIRISKGIARASSTFASTSALEDDEYTSLLIHSDGIQHTITKGGNTVHVRKTSTFTPKIDNSSIYFDDSGDELSTAASSSFTLDGEFTIEAWIKRNSIGGYDDIVDSAHYNTAGWDGNFTARINSSNKMEMRVYGGFSASSTLYVRKTGSTTIDTEWHHVAFVRDSSDNIKFYLDGSNDNASDVGSPTDESKTLCATTDGVIIGGGNQDFGGYIDEVRISDTDRSGESDFATAVSHTDDENTVLLIHSNYGGGIGGDDSGKTNDFAAGGNLAAHDQMVDTPSAGNNFATINPLDTSSDITLSEGNLRTQNTSASWRTAKATMSVMNVDGGKSYFEYYVEGSTSNASSTTAYHLLGLARSRNTLNQYVGGEVVGDDGGHGFSWQGASSSAAIFVYDESLSGTGEFYFTSPTAANTRISVGDIIAVAVDASTPAATKIWFGWADNSQSAGMVWVKPSGGSVTPNPGTGTAPTITTTSDPGELFPSMSNYTSGPDGTFNFGADHTFANSKTALVTPCTPDDGPGEFYYDVPAGFKALCTANLDAPGVNNAVDDEKAFAATLYEGDGETQTVEEVGFQPDLVWVKNRDESSYHNLVDTVRGFGGSGLFSNSDDDEGSASNKISSVNSDGFVITGNSNDLNHDDEDYISWAWKAGTAGPDNSGVTAELKYGVTGYEQKLNAEAGFSIIKYTSTVDSYGGYAGAVMGNSYSYDRVAHNLTAAPELIVIKNRDAAYSWAVWHKDLTDDYSLFLDTTGNQSNTGLFPTSELAHSATTFTIGGDGDGMSGGYENVNGGEDTTSDSQTDTPYNYIAYLFRSIDGYSKVGSYTGNGGPDGPFVYCGFRPAFLLIKNAGNDSNSWAIIDSERDPYNPGPRVVWPNDNLAESNYTSSYPLDFTSNGFKIRNTSNFQNQDTKTIIFYAVAELPFQYASAR